MPFKRLNKTKDPKGYVVQLSRKPSVFGSDKSFYSALDGNHRWKSFRDLFSYFRLFLCSRHKRFYVRPQWFAQQLFSLLSKTSLRYSFNWALGGRWFAFLLCSLWMIIKQSFQEFSKDVDWAGSNTLYQFPSGKVIRKRGRKMNHPRSMPSYVLFLDDFGLSLLFIRHRLAYQRNSTVKNFSSSRQWST